MASLSVVPPMGQPKLTALGQRMEEKRGALGLTQRAITDALGVSPQNWHRWKTGETSIQGDHLVQLARHLRTSAEWLMLGEQPSTEPRDAPPELQEYLGSEDGRRLCQDVQETLKSLRLAGTLRPSTGLYRALSALLDTLGRR